VDEERRTFRGEVFQEEPRSGLVRLEALELPSDPPQQRQVDVPEQGRQGRGCVSPVIPDPPRRSGLSFLAISASDRCVCRRMFKSPIVDRMALSDAGLTAGLNPQNRFPFRGFFTMRGRNAYLFTTNSFRAAAAHYQFSISVTHKASQKRSRSIRWGDSNFGGMGWARRWELRGRTTLRKSFAV